MDILRGFPCRKVQLLGYSCCMAATQPKLDSRAVGLLVLAGMVLGYILLRWGALLPWSAR